MLMYFCDFFCINWCQIDTKDGHGLINVYRSIFTGHESVVKMLIDNGADVNAIDNSNKTPLIIALENGKLF